MPIDIPQDSLDQLASLKNKHILVTGGSGFVGSHIVELLLLINANVTVFDVVKAKKPYNNVKYIVGDLTKYDDVYNALNNIHAVIHTASPSPTSRNAELFNNVNVNGTKNIINACKQRNIKYIIYTSSASVVFDGTDQMNYDETCPIPTNTLDSYTISKLNAEQLLLNSNNGSTLCTVALRPHTIFGEYGLDPYGIKGMVNAGLSGKSKYMFGSGHNIVDYTYVQNVAYAHVLATAQIEHNNRIHGQAYFITNAEPTYFWNVPCMIYNTLNVTEPYIQFPPTIMKYIANNWENIGRIIPVLKPPQSFTTQAIVYSTTHHYYNSKKARNDFNYIPPIPLHIALNRVKNSIKHLAKPIKPASRHITVTSFYVILFVLLTFGILLGDKITSTISMTIAILLVYRLYRTSTFGESVNLADTDIDLTGQSILITGGNKGIGYATAVGLCQRNASVIIATRDQKRGEQAVNQIKQEVKNAKISRMEFDGSSFDSIVKLVNTLKQQNITLNTIICNAGAMTENYVTQRNLDGQFQSNYLSHALLCILCIHHHVLDYNKGRIVQVSSIMNHAAEWPIDINILKGQNKKYNKVQMYNNTKLYQIMFNNKLHQLLHQNRTTSNITILSLHPGAVNTEFIDHFVPLWFHNAGNWLLNNFITRNSIQGSQSTLYCVCAPQLENVSNIYIDNCEPRLPDRRVFNQEYIDTLWNISIKMMEKYIPKDSFLLK